MKKSSGRRDFLKNITLSSAAAFVPSNIVKFSSPAENETLADKKDVPKPLKRPYNSAYTGDYLNRVAFPIGGIGSGMFCLEGTGSIAQVSTRNSPDMFNDPGVFSAIAVKGLTNGAKLLEGPVPNWKKFGLHDAGNGLGGSTTGLPHFHSASFKTEFPFAHIKLEDKDLPLDVKLTGWSPFIPTDDDNSSLPVGAIEYTFTNTGKSAIDAIFSFNSKNFLRVDNGKNAIREAKNGFILFEAGTKEKPYPSEFAVFTDDDQTIVDHCWFRGAGGTH